MKKDPKQTSPYHPDVILFLIFIPIISAINYYLTYSNVKFNGFLALTFTIDTLTGYMAWLAVRKLILYLDRALPYSSGMGRRMTLQLVGTTVLGLSIISALTELTSFIAKGEPAPLEFYTIDLIIIGIWFFFINAIYLGLYYYNRLKDTEDSLEADKKLSREGFTTRVGKKDVRIAFENLLGFFKDGDYTYAQGRDGRRYYVNQSLDKIESRIPEGTFFRLNRKCILHRKAISEFKRIENGKILVIPINTEFLPTEIKVSRTKAPQFKHWFHKPL